MSYLRLAQALPKVFGKGRGENIFCKKGFPHNHAPLKKEKSI